MALIVRKTSRQSITRALTLGALASAGLFGCSSSSSSGLTCGTGTVQSGNKCVASSDGGVVIGPDGSVITPIPDGGSDAGTPPPTFGGVTAVAPASDTSVMLVWNPGSEPGDPTATLRYRVYYAPMGTAIDYKMVAAQTGPSAQSVVIGGLMASTKYVFGVRALNDSGVEDSNTVTMTGQPATDTGGPTFGGATSAMAGKGGAVSLAWMPASDAMNVTPAAAMTYLVYESDTPGAEDYTMPTYVTAPGATSASVGHLPNAMETRYFVVRARDAAGNTDSNTHEVSSVPGVDVTAPTFGGCTAATTLQAITIGVAWTDASDDVTLASAMTYDVFMSTTAGKFDFTKPFATVKGMDSVVLTSLMTSTPYYFVCRAKDEAGNEDQNTIEVTATTGSNPTPPTFAGIDLPNFVGDPVARTATIPWLAATDPVTPPDKMLYDVYEANTPGGEDFTMPPAATSTAGALSIMLTNIPGNTTTYFVVRARDQDGNHDANTIEASLTTNVSFSGNVQPIFNDDCGVVGCHVPGNPTGGLILTAGFSYSQIVNVIAPESISKFPPSGHNYVLPGDPTNSGLAAKINYMGLFATMGFQGPMPAPSTGSTLTSDQINAIGNWILQGAANN
jgi:Fibronectin type III domain